MRERERERERESESESAREGGRGGSSDQGICFFFQLAPLDSGLAHGSFAAWADCVRRHAAQRDVAVSSVIMSPRYAMVPRFLWKHQCRESHGAQITSQVRQE